MPMLGKFCIGLKYIGNANFDLKVFGNTEPNEPLM